MHLIRSIGSFRTWGGIKKTLFSVALFTFMTSSFLYFTGPGGDIRQKLAETVITTQHRSWAWIFVGAERRDQLVQETRDAIERASKEKQDMSLLKIRGTHGSARSADELVKVEDISGTFWTGKKMYVYDPKTIRVMTPSKVGEGEKITSMVDRTGAVAGVNGGSFDDPEGLGNGFAAIGMIISGGDIVFTDQDGSIPQHIVGFTKEGVLVVGKYDAFELRKMGISEAVSFYPRLIANGKPLITSGDGGWGRAPRTAVGQKADGTVIFIVIDGRQKHSVGATLKEVQDLFLKEGVINAGNLDGGASSELVYKGDDDQSQLLSKPSSRYGERRLPSAFLVYDDPESVQAIRIWDGVDKIDAGGSYDHPEFLKEQAEKKANQPATTTKPAAEKSKTTAEPQPTNTGSKTTDPKKSTGTPPTDSKTAPSKTDPKGTTPASGGGTGKTGGTGSGTTGSGTGSGTTGTGTQEPSTGKPAGANASTEEKQSEDNGTGGTTNGSGPPAAGTPDSSKPAAPSAPASGTKSDTVSPPAQGTAGETTPAPATKPAVPVEPPPASAPVSTGTAAEGQAKP
ncbi:MULTISPECIES: phosphodiester glycosidase family protein [Paenibacillus]|uniref:phosphodiester glycosidase family protein n=1 Tax=Paenibacillus TaxID=44249 RepID=UPI0022B8FF24|nr:phosphodiester glycosidase family protein [Paenibacillus caseinilyticus]MCZ8519102.1 phosphodiester glycosidase family protein [Paenibacillus caseinilyticus]